MAAKLVTAAARAEAGAAEASAGVEAGKQLPNAAGNWSVENTVPGGTTGAKRATWGTGRAIGEVGGGSLSKGSYGGRGMSLTRLNSRKATGQYSLPTL